MVEAPEAIASRGCEPNVALSAASSHGELHRRAAALVSRSDRTHHEPVGLDRDAEGLACGRTGLDERERLFLYSSLDVSIALTAERIEKFGLGRAPVCMAKTHFSLSHDPALRNRPTDFVLPVRARVPSAGAGFVVALCGEMQRMPGFGKAPAFMNIDIDAEGRTVGHF